MDVPGLILARRADLSASSARLADLQGRLAQEQATHDQIQADIDDLTAYLIAKGRRVP
jgi:hypothetical protein